MPWLDETPSMQSAPVDPSSRVARARQRAETRRTWVDAHAVARLQAETAARAVDESAAATRAEALAEWWHEFWPAPWPSKKAQVKGVIRDVLLEAGAVDAAASGVPAARRAVLVARHAARRLTGARASTSSAGGHVPPPRVEFAVSPGVAWPGPLVSVIVRTPDEAARLTDALAPRALPPIEIVCWDARTRTARVAADDTGAWTVPGDGQLASTLLGKYAWRPPDDLAEVPNLLQLAVLALEAGQLEFVVGAVGVPGQAEGIVSQGNLPGSGPGEAPLVVARTEHLRDDVTWSFDRLGAPPPGAGRVAGRILSLAYSSSLTEPGQWTGRLDAADAHLVAAGPSIVVHAGSPPARVRHVLSRVDEALGAEADAPLDPRSVLVLFPYLAMGGAEAVTLEVLRRLTGPYRFAVATSDPLAAALGSTVADFLRVTPAVYPLGDTVDRPVLFSALASLVVRHRPGTVFVANGSGWIYDAAPALRARFPRLRLVNQVFDHGFGWINRYDAGLVATFDHHVAPNARIAQAYRDRGVDPARISVVHHGIDTLRFAPERVDRPRVEALRARLGIPPGRAVVTMAGRLHPQKRPLDFLALAHRFRPDEATFVLVGDGPLATDIDASIQRARLPHVVTLPFHRPVEDLVAMSSVMVILSEYEGLPLMLLEAQALGAPVVGTDVGAIREALEWTGGGRVIPVGDLAAAESAVRAMLAAPPDPARVRARLCERFDAAVCARGYAAAFAGTECAT
jgi:glycosyltransferase involved in cell wall biosynthesis